MDEMMNEQSRWARRHTARNIVVVVVIGGEHVVILSTAQVIVVKEKGGWTLGLAARGEGARKENRSLGVDAW